jgi:hypothetical protein
MNIPYPKKNTQHEIHRFLKWSIENGKAFWNKYIIKNSSKAINCKNIDLRSKKLVGFIFNNTDFSDSNFSNTTFRECIIINSKLNTVTISQTNFQNTTFRNCNLTQFDFRDSALRGSIFHNCKLDKTDFRRVEYLSSVEFKDSNRDDAYTCVEIIEKPPPVLADLEPKKLIVDFDKEIINKTHKEVVGDLVKRTKTLKGHIYYKGIKNPTGTISKSWGDIWENLAKSLKFLMNKQKGDELPKELLRSLDLEFQQIYHKEEEVLEVIFGYSQPEEAIKQVLQVSPNYSLVILSIISGIASVHKSYNEEINSFLLERADKTKEDWEFHLIDRLKKLQKGQLKTIPRFIEKATQGSGIPLPTYKKT